MNMQHTIIYCVHDCCDMEKNIHTKKKQFHRQQKRRVLFERNIEKRNNITVVSKSRRVYLYGIFVPPTLACNYQLLYGTVPWNRPISRTYVGFEPSPSREIVHKWKQQLTGNVRRVTVRYDPTGRVRPTLASIHRPSRLTLPREMLLYLLQYLALSHSFTPHMQCKTPHLQHQKNALPGTTAPRNKTNQKLKLYLPPHRAELSRATAPYYLPSDRINKTQNHLQPRLAETSHPIPPSMTATSQWGSYGANLDPNVWNRTKSSIISIDQLPVLN